MLSKRADAFEDVALRQSEKRQNRYESARDLLDVQADALMETDEEPVSPVGAHHAPYNPHRRPLSSAARRLVRAHEVVEQAAQE